MGDVCREFPKGGQPLRSDKLLLDDLEIPGHVIDGASESSQLIPRTDRDLMLQLPRADDCRGSRDLVQGTDKPSADRERQTNSRQGGKNDGQCGKEFGEPPDAQGAVHRLR